MKETLKYEMKAKTLEIFDEGSIIYEINGK